MQQIKNAVRKNDALPLGEAGAPRDGRVGRPDLLGGVQSGCVALGWKAKLWLKNGNETLSL